MQFFTVLAVFAASVSAGIGDYAKIQYYYDGGCSQYATEFKVGDFECINYDYGNTNSGNVAGCDSRNNDCECKFYQNRDCKGPLMRAGTDSVFGNCASQWGKGFKSVYCRNR
ncbi:hypothetical protein FVEN_g41 [Fusarium venenatum]|uniref:Uncharacterized protein n=1 Tax=Fusarium venenatum TaxID=56646 RepID=A0A2L2T1I7_9HYPO|nr:uncharacterized protein FVRRES_07874 [Fusarium venenatum]KAG8362474.1 hypothetical protein FVEN_g41 [Fusarium venenatum]KAH6994760.1 hypothetical protein EDB82DRAFT_525824 [Fusarium venenatum]CEI63438.1 unnamed protein product [Fusarium venenatum]